MRLEFAVLCDYAGYLPTGQFVVVAPAIDSVSTDLTAPHASVSLAGALRSLVGDHEKHTLRVDATSPEKSRFTIAAEQAFHFEPATASAESSSLHSFAVHLGAALRSPGDYLLHVVVDGRDVETLPLHVSQPSAARERSGAPSLAEIESMYQAEIEHWIALAKMTPSEETLRRVADRFVPSTEWFQEGDLFEPQAEPK